MSLDFLFSMIFQQERISKHCSTIMEEIKGSVHERHSSWTTFSYIISDLACTYRGNGFHCQINIMYFQTITSYPMFYECYQNFQFPSEMKQFFLFVLAVKEFWTAITSTSSKVLQLMLNKNTQFQNLQLLTNIEFSNMQA